MKKLTLRKFKKIINGVIVQDNFYGDIEYVGYRVSFIDYDSVYFYTARYGLRPSDFIDTNNIIVTDRKLGDEFEDFTIIRVKDIDVALERFVNYYRSLFDIPVIGVTGTCGKTTTKEMIKFILSKFYTVEGTVSSRNAGYFNLPYLVALDDNIDVAVYEMGVAEPDDINIAAMYFKPSIGIITNIGLDHFNGCKDLNGYIKAKAEMLEALNNKGHLILNNDDKNISKISLNDYEGRVLYFGKSDSDYTISGINTRKMSFNLTHKEKTYKVELTGLGEHNMYNATAAIAACHVLGIEINESIKILKEYEYIHKHLELKDGINGSLVIDDSFSSNPTSLKAAIDVLMSFSEKKVLIVSKMEYLDSFEEELHKGMGKHLTKVDYLITLDETSKMIAEEAIENGLSKEKTFMLDGIEDIKYVLDKIIDRDTVVLVKTSMLSNYNDLFDYLVIGYKKVD